MDGKELGAKPVSPESRIVGNRGDYHNEMSGGITLRQHFAGLFMASMVSDPRTQGERWDWLATQSTNAADALLTELAKDSK